MGSMATTPRPMSKNAPKGARCVTRAATTAPGGSFSSASSACSWGMRRESRATGAPFSSLSKELTVKHICFPTFEITDISRSAPLIQGERASALGSIPATGPRER